MRRNSAFLFCGLALACAAGPASAQQIRPISDLLPAGLFHRSGGGHDCADTCKVCVPVPEKKKVPHTVFSSKCVDYCLPRCTLGCLFRRGHDGCNAACGQGAACDHSDGCVKCGKVRHKNVLLKKVEICEVDSVKCKVEERPRVCAPACGPAAPEKGGKMMPPPAVYIPGSSTPTPVATFPAPAFIIPALPPAAPVPVVPLP